MGFGGIASAAKSAAGPVMGAFQTVSALESLLGPRSPLVTGSASDLASGIQGLKSGISDISEPFKAPSPVKVDPSVFENVPQEEIDRLSPDIRDALLGALKKESEPARQFGFADILKSFLRR